jgi:hypothetical protein
MTLRRVVIALVILLLAWLVVSVVLWSLGQEGPTRIGQGRASVPAEEASAVAPAVTLSGRVGPRTG